MSWSEIAPGLFQRPIGATEKGQLAAIAAKRPHPRELIKIHTFADITASHPRSKCVAAFRDAWKALRLLKSPDIATMFKGNHNQYKVPSDIELEEWLVRTFYVAPPDTAVDEVVRQMQNRLEFLPVIYIVPQSSFEKSFNFTMIIFISHWRTEASGCYQMINQLCNFASELLTGDRTRADLSNHQPGSEARLLVPTLEEIVMRNKQSSPESKARMEAHFNNYYDNLPSVDLTFQSDISTPPSNVLLNRHTYSTYATSELVAACKSKGFTVTAAVNSAYMGGVRELADSGKDDRPFTFMMPAQVRPRLPVDSPYRTQGCWNASQMMVLVVPAGQDFSTRAKTLAQQYAIAGQEQWWYEDTREVLEHMDQIPSRSPPEVVAIPWFTSLGILDRSLVTSDHDIIKVNNLWGWADPMGPGCVLTMWSFHGKLHVQLTWNATFHSESQIGSIMHSIDKILAKELNVEIGSAEITLAKY